jgi:heat shock protein HslJ
MTNRAAWLVVLFGVLAAAPSSADEPTLDGDWRLTGVQGLAVDVGGTLLVKDGHVSGSTGCNRFRASYTVKDAAIKVAPVAATKMYCQDRANVERAYLAALETVTAFELTGDKLVMHYQPGDKMLEFGR